MMQYSLGKPIFRATGLVATLVLIMCVYLVPSVARSADEVVSFDNPVHKQMYQQALKAYRCLKCQNQNLWDSNASLAADLRREIRTQIIEGKSKKEIDEYLVARYGEFVLYRPRFSAKTVILWVGPFVLLFIGLGSGFLIARGRTSQTHPTSDSATATPAESYSETNLTKARDILKH